MFGAYSRVKSAIVASMPAKKASYSESSFGFSPIRSVRLEGPQKTIEPSAPRSDRWM